MRPILSESVIIKEHDRQYGYDLRLVGELLSMCQYILKVGRENAHQDKDEAGDESGDEAENSLLGIMDYVEDI